jgi:type IV pilus assembly protein PilO
MKKATDSNSALAQTFAKIEELSKPQRIGIFVGILLVLFLGFGYYPIYPKWNRIDALDKQLTKAKAELATAKKNASQLNDWRNKMMLKEAEYKTVMQALPESAEIPSLLSGISQAGKDSGLEFFLFQPKAEIRKDFYAEIPVDINIAGSYHQVAMFFEKVSNLHRVVNIRNIKMTPQTKDSNNTLTTTCQAVTYKFIDEPSKKPVGKTKAKKGGVKK